MKFLAIFSIGAVGLSSASPSHHQRRHPRHFYQRRGHHSYGAPPPHAHSKPLTTGYGVPHQPVLTVVPETPFVPAPVPIIPPTPIVPEPEPLPPFLLEEGPITDLNLAHPAPPVFGPDGRRSVLAPATQPGFVNVLDPRIGLAARRSLATRVPLSPIAPVLPVAEPLPPVAPAGATSQYHSQDDFGGFSFGYNTGTSAKQETRTADGVTRGSYSYIDANGITQHVSYTADAVNGFRVVGTNIPVANSGIAPANTRGAPIATVVGKRKKRSAGRPNNNGYGYSGYNRGYGSRRSHPHPHPHRHGHGHGHGPIAHPAHHGHEVHHEAQPVHPVHPVHDVHDVHEVHPVPEVLPLPEVHHVLPGHDVLPVPVGPGVHGATHVPVGHEGHPILPHPEGFPFPVGPGVPVGPEVLNIPVGPQPVIPGPHFARGPLFPTPEGPIQRPFTGPVERPFGVLTQPNFIPQRPIITPVQQPNLRPGAPIGAVVGSTGIPQTPINPSVPALAAIPPTNTQVNPTFVRTPQVIAPGIDTPLAPNVPRVNRFPALPTIPQNAILPIENGFTNRAANFPVNSASGFQLVRALETILPSSNGFPTIPTMINPVAPLALSSKLVEEPGKKSADLNTQFQAQDEDGSFAFGFDNALSSRRETKDKDGVVRGSYSYVDAFGENQVVNYIADPVNGFRVTATDLPVAPETATKADKAVATEAVLDA